MCEALLVAMEDYHTVALENDPQAELRIAQAVKLEICDSFPSCLLSRGKYSGPFNFALATVCVYHTDFFSRNIMIEFFSKP